MRVVSRRVTEKNLQEGEGVLAVLQVRLLCRARAGFRLVARPGEGGGSRQRSEFLGLFGLEDSRYKVNILV